MYPETLGCEGPRESRSYRSMYDTFSIHYTECVKISPVRFVRMRAALKIRKYTQRKELLIRT